jgi:hypothetical protein
VKVINLFPTPLLIHKISDTLADQVEATFVPRLKNLPLKGVRYSDFWTGDKNKIVDVVNELPYFYDEIIRCKSAFRDLTGIMTEPKHFDAWTQDYRGEGQYHGRHHHGVEGISGVYWIRANEHSSDLTFYNPAPQIGYSSYDKDTVYTRSESMVKAKKGVMVLFPSYLEHSVGLSTEKTVRTTFAFNFGFNPLEKRKY